jgi:hypothetical protein
MNMRTTRHWYHENPLSFSSAEGELKENGDFSYFDSFGKNTIYKGHHFASIQDAATDLIKDIDGDIKALEARKNEITEKYLNDKK